MACFQIATGDRLSCLNATNAPTAAPTGGLRETAKAAAATVSAAAATVSAGAEGHRSKSSGRGA